MKKRRFSSDSFGSIKYFTDLQNHDSIYSCVLNTMVRVKSMETTRSESEPRAHKDKALNFGVPPLLESRLGSF